MQFIWLLPSLVVGGYFGSTTGNWYLAAMSAASAVAWFVQARVREIQQIDFKQPITLEGSQIWVGQKKLPKFRGFWRREWNRPLVQFFENRFITRDEISFSSLLADPGFRNPGRFKVWIGLDAESRPIHSDLIEDGAHILILGPTGSGKSRLLQLAITSMQAGSNAGQYEFAAVDFKGGSTFAGNWLGKLKFSINDLQPDQLQPAMHWLEAELKRRETLLAEQHRADFNDSRSKPANLPMLILVCDELPELLRQSRLALQTIETVSAKGRSLGVILMATTQSLTGIPRSILVNLRQRIALHGTDSIDLAQLGFQDLRNKAQAPNSTQHGGYWLSAKRNELALRFPVDFDLEKSTR